MNSALRSPLTGGHYSLIRILMGLYLTIHFLHLLPYGTELFSADGLLSAVNSPLMGIIPNPLAWFDNPVTVSLLLSTGAVCGFMIAIGSGDRIASIVALVLLGWLFARNPLIANPSLPIVGWMLLAHVFIPRGVYGSWSARNRPVAWAQWFYPRQIWIAAWILLAVAYSYSGYTKLLSPSWVDGSAIALVLENPLARDHFGRELLLALPDIFLKLLTWAVLVIELLFIPLCFNPVTRKWAWFAMLLIQFGFLTFLNFADLTFPMLLIHALTFDRIWLHSFRPAGCAIVFYDGECAFCNGLVGFALSEDGDKRLTYSPLQGRTFVDKAMTQSPDDSIAVLTSDGNTLYKSDAVIHCLEQLGGPWLLLARLIAIFPTNIKNQAYDFIGRIRYRLAGRIESDSCPLLPPEYAQQILP